MKAVERERNDWIIILIILLIGFLCVILAAGWALRASPSWKLNANMDSGINPNSDFLTSRPSGFIPPVDLSILTEPSWLHVFLTPGSSRITRTPFPTVTATSPEQPTIIPSATNLVVVMTSSTNTSIPIIWIPTSTPKPKPTKVNGSTATPISIATATATPTTPPAPTVDLQITKTDGVTSYTVGGSLTYTITAANNSATSVTGVLVSDNIPTQFTSWTWSCASQNGGAIGCDGITNSNANFSDSVDLPGGASIVYTVNATISATASGDLTNTATISLSGSTDPIPANNSASDTDTQIPSADLSITKTDGLNFYSAGATLTYTVTITNNGTSAVIGAVVTDAKPSQIATWSWACAAQTNGASGCDAVAANNTDFSDTVDLPVGSSIIYTVTANISNTATGDLINTASISAPVGYTDPVPANNTTTDTDTAIVIDPTPGPIGTTPDGNSYNLPSGSTLTLSANITVNGHASWDLVYYEFPVPNGILLDWVIIQISDGNNWYTVFDWGDNVADTNTNMDFNILSNPQTPPEPDQRFIPNAELYNSTGIAIDLDSVVPPGTYSYIRFFAPPGDVDGQMEIDAIQTLP